MSKIYGKCLFSLFFLAFLQMPLEAQSSFDLKLVPANTEDDVLRNYRYKEQVNDSLQVFGVINEVISALHNDGYLLAYLESLEKNERQFKATLSIGERFEWLHLKAGNLDKGLMRRAGFTERMFREKPFRYNEVARVQDRLVTYAEQNGFPFAVSTIDSLFISGNRIGGVLNFEPGPPIRFDSLRVDSDFSINSKFLGNFLDIKMGDLFDQRRINRVGASLALLPYLRVVEAPRVTFQNSEATLHLKLNKRRVNQIDGIVGFLPDANNDGVLLITGQFDILLYNPFGSGKKIGLHWRKQNVETQTLNWEYDHPNLLGSAINGSFDFDFLKQDTTFTKLDFRLELSYRLSGAGSFTVFTRQQATNRISNTGLADAVVLPEVLDFDLASYGIGFRWHSFDDFFLPKRGLQFSATASAGNKKISPNSQIPGELIDGLDLKNRQYELGLSLEKHSRAGQNLVLVNRFTGGLLVNDQLFRNDAIRLGGLNSIRGFNENFFFATKYATATVEGRLFFEEYSFLSVFTDVAAVYDGFSLNPETDFPVGVGAGISFSTDAGIFNFVYALGSSGQSGSLTLNQSKIHFGFTSRF